MKYLFCLLVCFFSTTSFSEENTPTNLNTANEVATSVYIDLNRYEGLWIEVARKYNKYSSKCNAFVVYQDYINTNNNVNFSTYCLDKNKMSMLIVNGIATPKDASNKIFSISTKSSLLSFLGFFHRIYYVIYYLDPEYKYAIIGDNKKSIISILAKDIVDEEKLQELLKITESLGVNVDNFYIDNKYQEDIKLLISQLSSDGKVLNEE
jgi:lipocalin